MTIEERILQLQEAQDRIHEAILCISLAVEGTSQQGACESYILGHLKAWADGENPYDATAIPRLVEHFDKEEYGDGE